MTNLDDVGVVVLNYMTIDAPKEMVGSLKKYYPNVRTVIVDNGSSKNVVDDLEWFSKQHKNTTVLLLDNNYGYPKGMNAGIRKLRDEGYDYICCSTTHMLINETGLLESLKKSLYSNNAAVAGPRVVTDSGKEKNPFRIQRYTPIQAKQLYDKYYSPKHRVRVMKERTIKRIKGLLPKRLRVFLGSVKKLVLGLMPNKQHTNKNITKKEKRDQHDHDQYVYSLHGSIIMLGPIFFKYYSGLDERTFMYWDEHILGEMLVNKELKAVYSPETKVIQREDITSSLVWKDKRKEMKYKHSRRSVRHWYHNHYLKNNNKADNSKGF